jgi:hypothetical protein
MRRIVVRARRLHTLVILRKLMVWRIVRGGNELAIVQADQQSDTEHGNNLREQQYEEKLPEKTAHRRQLLISW